MLGLTFLFPAVLYGAAAAAAPVIIHLIMRTKPRRIVFPALRFVRKTHQASLSKLRLKHILLLLMRMAVIGMIAFLIARWQIPSWQSAAKNTTPVAAVILIDNSGSMSARQAGAAILNKAKAMAAQIIDTVPPGSRIAILDTTGASGGDFLVDRKLAGQQAADVPAEMGAQTLATALAKAVALLLSVEVSPKELYVITDMAEHVWRDVPAQMGIDDIRVAMLDCGLGQDTNIALGAIKLDATSVPVDVTVRLSTTVLGPNVGGDVIVQTELDGKAVDERTVRLKAGTASILEVNLRPPREGLLHGRVILQHADSLEMDNVRYFTLQAHALPEMLLVADKTTDWTYFMMINALCPGEGRTWVRCQTVVDQPLTPQSLSKARVAVLANVPAPTDNQWQALKAFVIAGGQLWIVAGPLLSAQVYDSAAAQQLMPVALQGLEEPVKGIAWKTPPPGVPLLDEFDDGRNGALSDVLCKLRFSVQSVAADATVALKYADDVPAIVTRPLGDGTVMFWNFTPDPQYFSPMGLTQFAVLAQHAIRRMSGEATGQMTYHFGEMAVVPLPKSMKNPVVTVRKPGKAEEPAQADLLHGVVAMRADRLGWWTIRMTEGPRTAETGFSVNSHPGESALAAALTRKVLALFPPDSAHVLKEVKEIAQQRQMTSQPLDMAVPVLLILLALITAEAFFANRFYKQPATQEPPQP